MCPFPTESSYRRRVEETVGSKEMEMGWEGAVGWSWEEWTVRANEERARSAIVSE